MSEPTIAVTDGSTADHAVVAIPEPQPSGWLAWSRFSAGEPWTFAYGDISLQRDPYRCPSPLFETREAAIAAARKYMSRGGEIRVVRVAL